MKVDVRNGDVYDVILCDDDTHFKIRSGLHKDGMILPEFTTIAEEVVVGDYVLYRSGGLTHTGIIADRYANGDIDIMTSDNRIVLVRWGKWQTTEYVTPGFKI